MRFSEKIEIINEGLNQKYRYIVFSLLCVYLIIACYKLSSPGVQYDELLFVNGAQHDKHYSSFILSRWGDFPLLLMPYIGALKSYIYYPIINLFGVNIWTLRLPVILITMVSLFMVSNITYKFFSKEFSLVVLVLLVLDPILIYMTRLDVGPNALELFTKCLAIVFFYKFFIEKRSQNHLLFGFVVLGFGLFNKLNFLWFINAFYAAIFIFKFNILCKEIVERNYKALVPYFAILISYLMYITYFVLITMRFNLVEMSGFDGLFSKVEKKLMLMFYLFNGTNFLKYIYSFKDTRVNIYIVYFYGLVIVIGMILNLTSRENVFVKKYKKVYFFILLILLLEVIQIIVTKKATAPWHTFTLYPFFTLLLVHSMFSIYHTIVDSKKIFATMLLVAFVSLTMLYQLYILSVYFKVLGTTTRNIAWSNKIYELIDYTSKSNKKFVSLDWGLHTPLITFDNKENKYFEWCFILNEELNEDNIKELKSLFLQDSSMLYITHGTDEQVFPKTLDRIIKLAGEFGFDLIREKTFKDGDRDIYVVYSLRKKA